MASTFNIFKGVFMGLFVWPLVLCWQLLNQFLLSPWGLVVPMTLLIALVAFQQVQKSPAKLAQFYAEKLETCDEAELPQLIAILLQMGDAGIPGLVQGLASEREDVFSDCLAALQRQFERWQESDNREHHFRIFSKALLEACHRFSHAGQDETIRFADKMLRVPEDVSPDAVGDRHEVIVHCGQILDKLESLRQRRNNPSGDNFTHQSDTVASLNRRTEKPVLLASNGNPFVPTSLQQSAELAKADSPSVNPFSVPRSERLLAYERAQQENPFMVYNAANERLRDNALPSPLHANIEQKVAQNYLPGNISEEYSQDISTRQRPSEYGFLTPEEQNIPLERFDQVPPLAATHLMRLLHHPDPVYVESARRTLMLRYGFQENHLQLAWRLYHPVSEVRQEIVSMLPRIQNVQPSVWLTVLLNDPCNDVRYRAASFLATTNDPTLQRLLIEQGKRDSDVRIVNLANRLDGG